MKQKLHCHFVEWILQFPKAIISIVPMIHYNRKSYIYMQPIDDRMEFLESIIIRKFLEEKNFFFI